MAPPPPPPPTAPPPAVPAAPRRDLESLLGANWLSKLGIAALAVATALFLQYAFASGWIVPAARVAIGLAFASLLYGSGQVLLRRLRYRSYAQVLASGGIIVLFLTIYAGYALYHLIGFTFGFAVLAAAAVAASAMAVANKTEAVALLCLAGAFATPLLIRQEAVGGGDLLRFYAYLAGLNLWSGVLVRFCHWHSLTALAFGATWVLFFGAGRLHGAEFVFTEAFAGLFLFFACYGGIVAMRADDEGRVEGQRMGVALILAGCAAFVIASAVILTGEYAVGLPALAAVGVFVAILIGVMGATLPNMGKLDEPVRDAFRYLAGLALGLLMSLSVLSAAPVPASQIVPALVFGVFTYLVFLALAIHMCHTSASEGPGVFLLAVNVVTYVMAGFHVLSGQQLWGIDAVAIWSPVAAWITLCGLRFAPRKDEGPHHFQIGTVVFVQALPLIALIATIESANAFPILPATGVFFAEFLALSATWVAMRRRTGLQSFRGDLIGAFGNGAVFFALLMVVAGSARVGGVVLLCACAVAFAAYHGIIAGVVLRGARGEALLRFSYLLLALFFLTIAIPLQLRASYITLAWAIECALVMCAGMRFSDSRVRGYSAALLLLTVIKAVGVDMPVTPVPFRFLLNARVLAGASAIAASYLCAWLLWRGRETATTTERRAPILLIMLANLLTVIFLSLELSDLFGRTQAQQVSLAVFWSAYAAGLVWVGMFIGDRRLRWGGVVLLGIAAGKALFLDMLVAPTSFRLLLNARFGSGAAVVVGAYFTAWLLSRKRDAISDAEQALPAALALLANVFTILFVSLDLWDRLAGSRVQLQSLTVFWCVYACAMVWIGVAVRDARVRWWALVLLAIAAVKCLFLDAPAGSEPFRFLFNPRILAGASVIAAAYLSALALLRKRAVMTSDEVPVPAALVLIANVFTILFISLDMWDHFDHAGPRQLALTAFWCAYAVVLMAIGARMNHARTRWLALCLLSIALVKAVAADMILRPEQFRLLINTRMLSGAAVIVASYACAWLLWKRREITAEERTAAAILALVANVFTLVFVSLDLWDYFGMRGSEAGRASAQQLALSIFWSIYALIVMSVGIWRRLKAVRLFAMGLLYVSIVKVFVFDLRFLVQPYRIVSFFGLGVILLVVSLLYTRFEERLK